MPTIVNQPKTSHACQTGECFLSEYTVLKWKRFGLFLHRS